MCFRRACRAVACRQQVEPAVAVEVTEFHTAVGQAVERRIAERQLLKLKPLAADVAVEVDGAHGLLGFVADHAGSLVKSGHDQVDITVVVIVSGRNPVMTLAAVAPVEKWPQAGLGHLLKSNLAVGSYTFINIYARDNLVKACLVVVPAVAIVCNTDENHVEKTVIVYIGPHGAGESCRAERSDIHAGKSPVAAVEIQT